MKIFLFFTLFFSANTFASSARVYANKTVLDAADGPPHYEIVIKEEKQGSRETTTMTHVDKSGKDFCSQVLITENGQPLEYRINHVDMGGPAKITVTSNEVIFEVSKDGVVKTERSVKPENLIVGSSINKFIADHIGELAEGKSLRTNMAVIHMSKVYEIDIEKTSGDEPEVKSGKWLKLTMKSPNFIYRAFMPKMAYFVDAKTGRVIAFEGPISARKSDGNKKGVILYDAK